MDSIANIGIIISYILIALALIGLIIGVSVAVMQNWKDGGMYAVIGIVAIIIFFGIGYALSSDDISQRLLDRNFSDVATYRKSSAGLITFYTLAIIAGILLVVDVVKGFIDGN